MNLSTALMVGAACAAVISLILSIWACALAARALSRVSNLASGTPSTNSLRAELLEIREYMGKIDRWAKRINARDVMEEHRDQETGRRAGRPDKLTKEQLRERVGLTRRADG